MNVEVNLEKSLCDPKNLHQPQIDDDAQQARCEIQAQSDVSSLQRGSSSTGRHLSYSCSFHSLTCHTAHVLLLSRRSEVRSEVRRFRRSSLQIGWRPDSHSLSTSLARPAAGNRARGVVCNLEEVCTANCLLRLATRGHPIHSLTHRHTSETRPAGCTTASTPWHPGNRHHVAGRERSPSILPALASRPRFLTQCRHECRQHRRIRPQGQRLHSTDVAR